MSEQSPDIRAGISKRVWQIAIMMVVLAAALFGSAGRLDWWAGWVYIGLYLVGILINAAFMLRISPETVARRASAEDMKHWDKLVGGLWSLAYFLALPVVAGLDVRNGWTGSLPLSAYTAAVITFSAGYALFSWAMISNTYFSTVVRVQAERGHTVCTTGPYRFMRHPGYVGAVIQSIAAPGVLGSIWALIPGVIAALLMIARTSLEDHTLQDELPGYSDYAQRVRFRLIPGVW